MVTTAMEPRRGLLRDPRSYARLGTGGFQGVTQHLI
jgi:hypothetical protein